MNNYDAEDVSELINSMDKEKCNKTDLQVLEYLEMLSEMKKIKNIPEPTPLIVSTKSAKCKLTHILDMEKLAPLVKKIVEENRGKYIVGIAYGNIAVGKIKKKKPGSQNFFNQVTIIALTHLNGKEINIKFFLNGSISMTGCKEDNDGIEALKNFINEIKEYDVFYEKNHKKEMNVIDYKITLINSNYLVGFRIDRAKLYELLIQNYKIYVSYDPAIYQGVKISYMYNEDNLFKDGLCKCEKKCRLEKHLRKKNKCKIVTIAVFQSGNIIITGASYMKQSYEAYNFINQVLYDNYSIIVRFSILDLEEN